MNQFFQILYLLINWIGFYFMFYMLSLFRLFRSLEFCMMFVSIIFIVDSLEKFCQYPCHLIIPVYIDKQSFSFCLNLPCLKISNNSLYINFPPDSFNHFSFKYIILIFSYRLFIFNTKFTSSNHLFTM